MTVAETIKSPDRIVREAECRALTGLSRAQRYKMENAGQFPRRVPLVPGGQHHGWPLGELKDWLSGRLAERDKRAAERSKEAAEHAAA